MGKLVEDMRLRDRVRVFKDRAAAGSLLAEKLAAYRASDALVLAIPAGGVPVAYEIAVALAVPLDIIIVRKIQIPGNTEAGFGAIGPDGEVIFNEQMLRGLRLTEKEIAGQVEKTRQGVEKRISAFRKGKPYPDVTDRTVILADDGLASGYTMSEAVRFMKRKKAKKIIIAVPTAPLSTVTMLLPEADELFCLNIRSFSRFAVAEAYEKWYDLDDSEVISLLQSLP